MLECKLNSKLVELKEENSILESILDYLKDYKSTKQEGCVQDNYENVKDMMLGNESTAIDVRII